MIASFADEETRRVFQGRRSRRLPGDIQVSARRRLRLIHRAGSLSDIAAVHGNRLEALRGDRAGQHSIRINTQWRVCFTWRDGDVYDAEIVDYH